ncbi:MAG TPA: cytochrome C oxidase subunit IV family protein [Candidatus Polarisedimenticolaceae bacterium]|nr:cytochrome C oxidase subunit IV family protein [Candidatus Polarisedimenticolaceae bacterium]
MGHRTAHSRVGHVVPLRVLFGVLATLLILTYVTVAVSWRDFGRYNLWIAIGIAVVKASIVLLFFMHLKYDKPFNAVIVITSLALLMLFIVIALDDTREYLPNQIPGYAPSITTNPQ